MDETHENVIPISNAVKEESPKPLFPMTLTLQGGVAIELFADGRWVGNGRAFLAGVKDFTGDGNAHTALLVWLIARAVQSDMVFNADVGE